MNIRVIVPVTTKAFVAGTDRAYQAAARPDTIISTVGLDRGPASIECDYEEALALPDLLLKVRAAAAEGMDAVVIDCMMDPGLAAARELVDIPVIGPAQAAFHLAAMLAHRFSVVTILERDIPLLDRLFRQYGVAEKIASARVINIPVLDLDDEARVASAAAEAAAKAVEEDGAHAIVFGCTGMRGVTDGVAQALREQGLDVPVINPSVAALKLAESLVDMGLSHSKRTYPVPPPKEIVGYL